MVCKCYRIVLIRETNVGNDQHYGWFIPSVNILFLLNYVCAAYVLEDIISN